MAYDLHEGSYVCIQLLLLFTVVTFHVNLRLESNHREHRPGPHTAVRGPGSRQSGVEYKPGLFYLIYQTLRYLQAVE